MGQEKNNGKQTAQNSVRKRVPNACTRCRQQKIRCRGGFPCDQCTKKKLDCIVDDRLRKVLVTQSFISDLEAKVAFYEGNGAPPLPQPQTFPTVPRTNSYEARPDTESAQNQRSQPPPAETTSEESSSQELDEPSAVIADDVQPDDFVLPPSPTATIAPVAPPLPTDHLLPTTTVRSSPEPQLMNPLALGVSAYTPHANRMPIYLGTSSTWSFGRRVLGMAHEQILGTPLPSENLLFQSETYDLGWDGFRGNLAGLNDDAATLPTADHAVYLINAVKFHVGQMFHLFDEESFMRSFSIFHNPTADKSALTPLWITHYMFILAFGKAFLARTVKGRRPPGAEFFVQAMKTLPDVTFLCMHPIETLEILCCATLYMQSIDFRSPAYQLIGQALRVAIEHGMHTDMQSQHIPEALAQRCHKIWWTVYVLDRQLSSLMGAPSSIRDEDISAGLPFYPDSPQRSMALDIQVRLSRVIAKISNSVYGPESRLDMNYVGNTKEALCDIAVVTNQLYQYFDFCPDGSILGISRLSAYLHILHHQCIILTTRPLLFTFLEARLHFRELGQRRYASVKTLLKMCLESAFQTLRILANLQEQGLLECFLSFDLDATFSSTVVVLMAASIDHSLLDGNNEVIQRSYLILEEMRDRGNLVADFLKRELQQLDSILSQAQPIDYRRTSATDSCHQLYKGPASVDSQGNPYEPLPPFMDCTIGAADWQYTMTTEQMIQVADSLDFDGIDWTEFQSM